MQVTDSIRYVGVNDHQVDLFEGQYQVPNGMSYNSYVILEEKVAVMDTVDIHFEYSLSTRFANDDCLTLQVQMHHALYSSHAAHPSLESILLYESQMLQSC